MKNISIEISCSNCINAEWSYSLDGTQCKIYGKPINDSMESGALKNYFSELCRSWRMSANDVAVTIQRATHKEK